MRLFLTAVLGVLALALLPDIAFAVASSDVSVGSTPSFVASVFTQFESAFTSRASSAAAALMSYALRFLALSFLLLLVWRATTWLLEGKHLASLIGTVLNLMLHYAIVLAFLVPIGSGTGYAAIVSLIQGLADSVATAASGGAFASGGAAITTGVTSMLQSGFTSLQTLSTLSAGRMAAETGFWSALTSGSVFTGMLEVIAVVLAGFAILIATAYAGFQLAKVILYGVIMFALGAAVGPFFLAFLLLPPTKAMGEHWFKFMLNAAFIKVVAFFMVGVVTSLGSSLIPPVTDVAQLTSLGTFAILASYLALILVYCMVGWVLGQSITIAGSLFGGSIGGFSPGLGIATLAAGVAGAAVGAAARGLGAAKAAASDGSASGTAGASSGSGGGGGGGGGGTQGGAPSGGSGTGNTGVPASANASLPGANATPASGGGGASTASNFTAPATPGGQASSAGIATGGVAASIASAVVSAATSAASPPRSKSAKLAAFAGKAALATVKAPFQVAGAAAKIAATGTRTGGEMAKAFNRGHQAFAGPTKPADDPKASAPKVSTPSHTDARASRASSAAAPSDTQQRNAEPAADTSSSTPYEKVPEPASAGSQGKSMPAGGKPSRIERHTQNQRNAAQARTDAVAAAMRRHEAQTGASPQDASTVAAGKVAYQKHNDDSGKTAYVNRSVAKAEQGMTNYRQGILRQQKTEEAASNAAKSFDSRSPEVIARYIRGSAKKAPG